MIDFRIFLIAFIYLFIVLKSLQRIKKVTPTVVPIVVFGLILRGLATALFSMGQLPSADSRLYAEAAKDPMFRPGLDSIINNIFLLKVNTFLNFVPGSSELYYSSAFLGMVVGVLAATLLFLSALTFVDSRRARLMLALFIYCSPGFVVWHSDNLKEPYVALGLALVACGFARKSLPIQLLGLVFAAGVRPELAFVPVGAFFSVAMFSRSSPNVPWKRIAPKLWVFLLAGCALAYSSGVYRTLRDRPQDSGATDLAHGWTGSVPFPGIVRVFTGIEPWANPLNGLMLLQMTLGGVFGILLITAGYRKYRANKRIRPTELWCLLSGLGGSAVVVLSSDNAALIDRIRSSYLLLLVPLIVGCFEKRNFARPPAVPKTDNGVPAHRTNTVSI
jgi:hypothetical protein